MSLQVEPPESAQNVAIGSCECLAFGCFGSLGPEPEVAFAGAYYGTLDIDGLI